MNILGVRVDNLSREEIIEKINCFLGGERFHQIATVNPEIVLKAQEDEEYKNILNSCDLNVADGFGLNLAFWKKGEKLKCRFAGADLMEEVLRVAEERRVRVFLVCSKKGLSSWEKTRDNMLKKYPKLEIAGADMDSFNSNFNPEIILCNFGAPQQEKFLNSLKGGKIKLAIGVGGSFDYFTGKIRRAPLAMRKLGLEWLWRLILEPRYRIKRIWKAVVVFPMKLLFEK